MMDALKGYVQLATGLTEVTAAKARDAASALVNQGMQWTGKSSDAMESVQDIADDLLVTSQQNREALMVSSDDVLVVDEVVAPEVTPSPDAVLPVWESTGNADVDGALESLHALADTDVTQHVGVFEEVESALRATLNGLVAEDEASG